MTTRNSLSAMHPVMEENFYMRWREMMLATRTHGGFLVANSRHEGFFRDQMERLAEDPWWIMSSLQDAIMYFDDRVPVDDLLIWTPDQRLVTPQQFWGNVGFGRLSFKAPSTDGIRPWDTAIEQGRPIRPDRPGEGPQDAPE